MANKVQADNDSLPPPGWKRNPGLLKLKALDEYLSRTAARAYERSTRLAEWHPKLRMLERSAHTLITLGVALFLWCKSTSMETRAVYANIIMGMCIDALAVAVLKSLARRRRPGVTRSQYQRDASGSNLSFPSGFVTRAVVLSLIFSNRGFSSIFHLLFLVWAVSITVIKIAFGRFFIGDALAGVPIGYIVYRFLDLIWLDPSQMIGLECFFGDQLYDE